MAFNGFNIALPHNCITKYCVTIITLPCNILPPTLVTMTGIHCECCVMIMLISPPQQIYVLSLSVKQNSVINIDIEIFSRDVTIPIEPSIKHDHDMQLTQRGMWPHPQPPPLGLLVEFSFTF